jgi:hypothetical protein
MRSVALRITTTGGDVDFYEDEVEAVTFKTIQDLQLHERQTKNPIIFSFGDQYNIVEVNLFESHTDTFTKMNTVVDLNEQVTIYYRYKYSATGTISAIPIIDQDQETRLYGFKKYGSTMTVRFLKSA